MMAVVMLWSEGWGRWVSEGGKMRRDGGEIISDECGFANFELWECIFANSQICDFCELTYLWARRYMGMLQYFDTYRLWANVKLLCTLLSSVHFPIQFIVVYLDAEDVFWDHLFRQSSFLTYRSVLKLSHLINCHLCPYRYPSFSCIPCSWHFVPIIITMFDLCGISSSIH